MVNAGQQSIAIDKQTIGLGHTLGRGLRIANGLPFNLLFQLLQVLFAYHVGRNNHLPIRPRVEERHENLFIRRPAATRNKQVLALHKILNQRQMLAGLLYLQHAVEPRIARNRHVADAYRGQQAAALLVLHKEMRETSKHLSITLAIPTKENLVGTEDAANAICRHTTMLKDVQVVVPKLVLDEKGHHGAHQPQETAGVERRVERQVTNNVGSFVVLSHLVARRREKR